MKKYIIIIKIFMLALMLPIVVIAQNPPGIYINGAKADGQQSPVMVQSEVYVPVAVLTDVLKLDGELLEHNDQFTFQLKDSSSRIPAMKLNGIPYLSASLAAEQLGMKLTRDKLTGSVYLFDRMAPAEEPHLSGLSESSAVSDPPNRHIEGVTGGDEFFNWVDPGEPSKIAVIDGIVASGERVEISADSKLQSGLFRLTSPPRIVLDIPSSRLADSMNGKKAEAAGEIATKHPAIGKIRYAQFNGEPSTVRIVIDLNRSADVEVSRPEHGKIVLTIPRGAPRVVIDAGHGGHDAGSPGASKKDEKWYTLSVAKKVFALLQKESDIEPVMMRGDDTYISPADRATKANELNADLFVSIHANSFESPGIRGTETYYYHQESLPFAEVMHAHMLEATGFPDRNVKKMNYIVIKETKMVSALLEIGYLSNPKEESAMLAEDAQNRVAAAVVKGIKAYFQTQ